MRGEGSSEPVCCRRENDGIGDEEEVGKQAERRGMGKAASKIHMQEVLYSRTSR